MANTANAFDFAAEDLATFLATVVDDGTNDSVVGTLKVDENGSPAAATQIFEDIGQLWGNIVDDYIQAGYPLLRQLATGLLPGDLTLDSGSPTLTIGDATGSPELIVDKSAGGDARVIFQQASTLAYEFQLTSVEDLFVNRAGAIAVHKFQADGNQAAFGNLFFDFATPLLTLGDGTGEPDIITDKSAGGTSTIEMRVAGVQAYAIGLDGSENLFFDRASGTRAVTFQNDGNVNFVGAVTIQGTLNHIGTNVAFYNHASAAQQTITGSRGGNAALADLLTKLALSGLIIDSTS